MLIYNMYIYVNTYIYIYICTCNILVKNICIYISTFMKTYTYCIQIQYLGCSSFMIASSSIFCRYLTTVMYTHTCIYM